MSADLPTERTGTLAYRCMLCEEVPTWQLLLIGPVYVRWACDIHLASIADDFLDAHHREISLKRCHTHLGLKPEVADG